MKFDCLSRRFCLTGKNMIFWNRVQLRWMQSCRMTLVKAPDLCFHQKAPGKSSQLTNRSYSHAHRQVSCEKHTGSVRPYNNCRIRGQLSATSLSRNLLSNVQDRARVGLLCVRNKKRIADEALRGPVFLASFPSILLAFYGEARIIRMN